MNENELVYFAQWHMRCSILRYASRESCILSVRILADILARLGIRSVPLAVGVIAANEVAVTKLLAGEDFTDEDADGANPPFAHRCMHKGMPGEGQWYNGHITLLAGGRYLCDPSADQFSHVEKDLLVIPLMIDLGNPATLPPGLTLDKFLDGDSPVSAKLPNGGGAVTYEAHQDDISYRTCMDWEDSVPGDKMYDRVLETTLGIVDLYAEAGGMPDLPELPHSHGAKDIDIREFEVNVVRELGYTEAEMRVKDEREKNREKRRQLEAQEREGDEDTSMLRSTRRAGVPILPQMPGPKP